MAERTRFLILSLEGEQYALPIARLLEITVPRNIQADTKLAELFEGRIDYRGRLIPVLSIKKLFKIPGAPGATLLVVTSSKGILGLLVDGVSEIMDTDQTPAPLPPGVVNPSYGYYSGVVRHKDGLVLLLNEDGLLP